MGWFLELLDHYCLGDIDSLDEMLWLLDEEKGFFVKSIYEELAPLKSYYFSWQVCLEFANPNQILFSHVGAMVEQDYGD